MAQAQLALSGLDTAPLPIRLPLRTEQCDLPNGIVISPFCGSEGQATEEHMRVWYVDRWRAVINALLERDGSTPIYIIGGPKDDPDPFLGRGVRAVMNLPLTQVLELMQRAPLFLSIETGTAHLAHFGGVSQHVLLYPINTRSTTFENPRAKSIRAFIKDITAEMVRDAAMDVLNKTRGEFVLEAAFRG